MSKPGCNVGTRRAVGGTLAAAALLAFTVPSARADVRYTTQWQMAPQDNGGNAQQYPGGSAPGMEITKFVKGNSERSETSFQMGPMKSTTISIEQCGTHEEIKLDPADKLYAEDPLGAVNFGPPPTGPQMRSSGRSEDTQPSGTGTVDVTVNVQNLGSEKIGALTTKHAIITMRTITTGCQGNNDTTMKIETWTAPVQTYDCPERYAPTRQANSPGRGGSSGCKVTYSMHGDVAGLRGAYGGMIVQMKMYKDDKVVGEQNMVDYSTAALDPSLFQVPPDYRLVSDEDLQKAQSKAMMNAFMHGGFGGQPPSDNGQTDNGQNSNPPADNGDNTNPPADTPPPKKKGGFHIPFSF